MSSTGAEYFSTRGEQNLPYDIVRRTNLHVVDGDLLHIGIMDADLVYHHADPNAIGINMYALGRVQDPTHWTLGRQDLWTGCIRPVNSDSDTVGIEPVDNNSRVLISLFGKDRQGEPLPPYQFTIARNTIIATVTRSYDIVPEDIAELAAQKEVDGLIQWAHQQPR